MANSYLDLAVEVLKTAKQPLTYQEIWDAARTSGLSARIRTSGKTPWQSLGAQLYVEVRDNPESQFIKVGKRPARFFLRDRQSEVPSDLASEIERDEAKRASKAPKFKERDLHPLLAYFAYANPSFNRGRSIYTKTILHEKSVEDVKIDFESRRIHRAEYDEVVKDPVQYTREKLKIERVASAEG
jgi:hypothetical protein